jgi:hypothetical protein
VASVEKDTCLRLASVAGDERAGNRGGHHHVASHADPEGQADGSADQRAQPPASRRRFPDAAGQTHDFILGQPSCGQRFGQTQDEHVPVDYFNRPCDALAGPQQHDNIRVGHRGKIRQPYHGCGRRTLENDGTSGMRAAAGTKHNRTRRDDNWGLCSFHGHLGNMMTWHGVTSPQQMVRIL